MSSLRKTSRRTVREPYFRVASSYKLLPSRVVGDKVTAQPDPLRASVSILSPCLRHLFFVSGAFTGDSSLSSLCVVKNINKVRGICDFLQRASKSQSPLRLASLDPCRRARRARHWLDARRPGLGFGLGFFGFAIDRRSDPRISKVLNPEIKITVF